MFEFRTEETRKRAEKIQKLINSKRLGEKFSVYKITTEYFGKKDVSKKDFMRVLASVKRIFKILEEEGKIRYVGEEISKAPVKRKVYVRVE
ncbi:MAG: hypothetical protein QXG39_00075 [Candidatus Aenigmatarchaeota archaeon]